jgi:hypothetical protein
MESNPESEGATAMKDYGKTVKFTPDDLIKETGSDLIAECNKFFGQSGKNENQHLKDWITKLERENHELKDETVRIYQQMLSLYRAIKKANLELDKIEESCDNNVWFQKIKERTY